MHGADCPTCGTHIELDFKPVSGLVWCPACQKLSCLIIEIEDPEENGQGNESDES